MAVTITEYLRPGSLAEGLELLAHPSRRAMLVGGGVSVVLSGAPRPVRAVDLRGHGLEKIEVRGHWLRIGALATFTDVIDSHEAGHVACGLLPAALRTAGTLPLRNQITVGGNIVQCYYWSTLPPVLMCLDARIVLVSAEGQRTVSCGEFFAKHPLKCLRQGEIVKRIEIPLPGDCCAGKKGDAAHPSCGAGFYKFARTGNDFAWVHACAVIHSRDGQIAEARLSLGALDTLPVRCAEAEQYLAGKSADAATAAEAGRIAARDCKVNADIRASREYRRHLAAVTMGRVIEVAAGIAGDGGEVEE